MQEVVLQQLKSSNTLELLFVCAKANVAPVSQAALNCLVLIWQWYLRKSPSASFSDSQLSCFLGTDLSDAAVAQDKAILDTGSDSFMMPAYAGQQQQQQDRQAMHGANADPGVWRASPHDSMASQIQSHPHKQQQQQQHQPQPSKGFAPLQQQQASQHTQEQQQHLWSETPVVNFAESAVEVLPEGNAGAVPSSASKQTSSRSTGTLLH